MTARETRVLAIGALLVVATMEWAYGAEIAFAESEGGVRLVLTDEPCRLSAVENLARRALWTEGRETFDGCYGINRAGIVMLYFSDKTVAAIPASAFQRVTGI